MVALLSRRIAFPPATSANEDGLVAIGGDLSIERLLLAYRSGIFPWPVFRDEIMTWFSPEPRAILELDALHVPKSLRKRMRRGEYAVTFDRDFATVIHRCAECSENRESTWITPDMIDAYIALHRAGHAHSVECRLGDEIVGGLYGVAIRGLFAGESMFSRRSDASKVAVVHLVERLRARGFLLLDIQQATPHMVAMGAKEISRADYLARLRHALESAATFHPDPRLS